MNLAPPLVQASAYQFILDRCLGEYMVPDGYSVIGAGNRLEDRAIIRELRIAHKSQNIFIDPIQRICDYSLMAQMSSRWLHL